MSPSNPNTHQRPDEEEPKKHAPSGKRGFMNALRAGKLARLLGAAPLVAPTAAAVTSAAIVGAPSTAHAQDEGGDVDMEELKRIMGGGDKPAPTGGGGGGKKKGGGGGGTETKKPDEVSPVMKLWLEAECKKRGIKIEECTVELLTAKMVAEEGTPLTDADFFGWQIAIVVLLAMGGVGIWQFLKLRKSSARTRAVFLRMGVEDTMTDVEAAAHIETRLSDAAADTAARAVAALLPAAGAGPVAGAAPAAPGAVVP